MSLRHLQLFRTTFLYFQIKLLYEEYFSMKLLFDKDSTYSLRGICMLMIIASHTTVNSDDSLYSILHFLLFDYWGAFGTGLFFFYQAMECFFHYKRQKK